MSIEEIMGQVEKTIGQWFSESSEYCADDNQYNLAYIDSTAERLSTILFQRGILMLNEVREALGFERIAAGALLGWTAGDYFNINRLIAPVGDVEKGESLHQIWVTWSSPKYVYEEIEYK